MKYLIISLLLSSLPISLNAQITLSRVDFMSMNDANLSHNEYTSNDVTGLSTLAAAKGPNVSWALGSRSWTSGSSSQLERFNFYSTPGDAPYAADTFAAATHYNKDVNGNITTYNYYQVTDAGVHLMGSAQVDAGYKQVLYTISPPIRLIAFPIKYGANWTAQAQYLATGQSTSMTIIANCDGYGMLTTPTGAGFKNVPTAMSPALRISYTLTVSSIQSDNYLLYYGYDHSMAITLDETSSPTSVDYSETVGAGVRSTQTTDLHLSLTNNPSFDNQTSLSYEIPNDGNIQITITDPLGRMIQTLQEGFISAGKHMASIDESKLSGGTYFVRIAGGGISGIQKFIIVK